MAHRENKIINGPYNSVVSLYIKIGKFLNRKIKIVNVKIYIIQWADWNQGVS